MKSLMPRFSRKTPEDEVVLNRKETSALSSPWNVGKWRYDVSLSKNAAFHTFSANKDTIKHYSSPLNVFFSDMTHTSFQTRVQGDFEGSRLDLLSP